MMRSVVRPVAVFCLGVVGVGCNGNEGRPTTAEEPRIAVFDEALSPPGTALAPGVEVQSGSRVVGTSFPIVEFFPNPGAVPAPLGWQALLVVDGDPITVWDRYVGHLGAPDSARAERSCVVVAVEAPSPEAAEDDFLPPSQRFITEAPIRGENRLECSATVGRVSMNLAVGAAPCLDSGCDLRAASHLFIRVVSPPSDHGFEQYGTDELRNQRAAVAAADPDAVVEPIPVPTGPIVQPELTERFRSHLPAPGERMDDGLDYYLDRAAVGLVPPAGSSLVAPALLVECNSGLVALLKVPGTAAEAVASFDEPNEGDDLAPVVQGTDADGRPWAGGFIGSAGGYDLNLVALETDDGTSTVLVTECGD